MSTQSRTPRKPVRPKPNRTVKVDYLARVEGEGALFVKIRDRKVADVELRIFEPPRFFEAFLRGRHFTEVPDITARICGICPVAYQLSSAHAMEEACGVTAPDDIRRLRHLLYCGEWIESHALHIYLLHAPDFLGYEDAIRMASVHHEAVQRGLKLKKIGNEIMTLLGGREIHPINVRVGGFYRAPSRSEMKALVEPLTWARQAAIETVRFTASLEMPEFDQDYEFVALSRPDEYAILDGRLVSNKGLDIPLTSFLDHFYEEHVARSTSLHAALKARGAYMVGPLARYNLGYDRLRPVARETAESVGYGPVCTNPYKSIVVRSIEMLHAVDLALELVSTYDPPRKPFIVVEPREGTGTGCTEAPRGICWHRYSIDHKGLVTEARIVPPTSQNQKIMESDLRAFVSQYVDLPDDELQWKCEQSVRNYDPCISCSCHYLKLHIDRG